MKRLPHIDGLRALAVLPVIFYHFGIPPFTGGYAGVDVFFVISGFLITGIIAEGLEKNTFSLKHFYERRARRILPAFFAMCALCCIAALFLLLPQDFASFSKALKGSSVFASNFIFARNTGYFAESLSSQPLLHTWSLAVEEQFYILFPLLLMLYRKKPRRAAPLLLALLGASLFLCVWVLETRPERAFYLLPTRAWELLLGAVFSLYLRNAPLPKKVAEASALLGLVLLAFSYIYYTPETPFPGLAAIVPALGAALLIRADLHDLTFAGRLLSSSPAKAVGLVSYGLYLYHWPLLVFSQYYLGRAPLGFELALIAAATAALSVLSWAYIEQPVRKGAVLKRQKPLFALSLAGLAALCALGFAGVLTHGLPGRFPPAVLQYAKGAEDVDWAWVSCLPRDPLSLSAKNMCVLGDAKRKPSFLLWGDSHASAFQPAVSELLKKYGTSAYAVAYAGCPPLSNARRADGYVDFDCAEIADKVFAFIRESGVKTVLLAARWGMYAHGFEKGGSETTRHPRLAHGRLEGEAAFRAAYLETIARLRALGVAVAVIRQAPPHLVEVPTALARAEWLGHDRLALRRPYGDVRIRRAFVNGVFNETKYARLLDPAEILCPDEKYCLVENGGRSLYSDNNHLSVTGALFAKDALEPFFRTLR